MTIATGFDRDSSTEVARLLQAGDFPAAQRLLGERRPRNTDEEFEHAMLTGCAATMLGRYHEALEPLLRALRMSRRPRRSRVRIRLFLGHVLLGAGDLARAERQLQRGLAELRATREGLEFEPKMIGYLASVQRRRGMIGFAIRTHEEALALAQKAGVAWGGYAMNLANALLIHDDLDRMGELLAELERRPDALSASQLPYLHVQMAVHAMESKDPDRAERALAFVQDRMDRMEVPLRMVGHITIAWLERARGRPDLALERLERIAESVRGAPALMLVASGLERSIAETLCQLGRPSEGLEHAQHAVRLGRTWDPFDWAEALRIAAECQFALGRTDAARTSLAESHSVLQTSECRLGRRNLEATARRLGIELETPSRREVDPSAPNVEPTWLALADGRSFLSLDPRLVAQLRRYAASDLPVLIEGETGTGKELVARLLHELGPRSRGPLVIVDCATLSEGLAEAELFGAARGAYTGAVTHRDGLVAGAHGGTLFLDELTELSKPLQAMLLRLLQEGTYRRLGDTRERKVDTRVVAATNRSVDPLVQAGAMRRDLFYRLAGHRLQLTPLRERPREIRLLADEFARAAGLLGISSAAQRRLASYPWPGNVRELQMLIRTAATDVAPGGWLDERALAAIGPDILPSPRAAAFRVLRAETERSSLVRTLAAHDGNVAAAARALGISRQAFYKAMHRLGVTRSDVNGG